MIVYQVSCQVNKAMAEMWTQYFKNVHLDDILDTGCFTGCSFRRSVENDETVLFVSEYYCTSLADLERYNQEFADSLKSDITDKFGGQFSASRNVFQILSEKEKLF